MDKVNFSVKNQQNARLLLDFLERGLPFLYRRFQMILKLFGFCLTLPVPEKLKNPKVDIPITRQTLNINN